MLQGVVQRLQAGGSGGDWEVVRERGGGEGQLGLRQDVDGGVAGLGEGAGVGLVRLQVRHDLMVADGDAAAAVVRDAVAGVVADGDVAGSVLADGDVAGRLLMLLLAPLNDADVAGNGDVDVLQQLRLVHVKLVGLAMVLQDVRQKLLLMLLLQLFLCLLLLHLCVLFGSHFELFRVGPCHVRGKVFLARELLAA